MSAMDFIADLFRGWEKGDSAPFFAALSPASSGSRPAMGPSPAPIIRSSVAPLWPNCDTLIRPRLYTLLAPAGARDRPPRHFQGALQYILAVTIDDRPIVFRRRTFFLRSSC